MSNCRCGDGVVHVVGAEGCEYGFFPSGPHVTATAEAVQRGRAFAPPLVLSGSDGLDNEIRSDYQRQLLRQSQRIGELNTEKDILKRQQELLVGMIEELIEQDIPDIDPHYYRKRIAKITDG